MKIAARSFKFTLCLDIISPINKNFFGTYNGRGKRKMERCDENVDKLNVFRDRERASQRKKKWLR